MKKQEFCELLGDIDEQYIEEARTAAQVKKPAWRKWAALAACLCLLAAAVPIVSSIFHKGGPSDNEPQAIAAFMYNGCYYEACDIKWVLEKFGLPAVITADMAGEHMAYLTSDGGAGYKETVAQTDIELYEYAPVPCRAVYVLRDGENYMAALFCNFLQFDTNTNYELSTLYQLYGIEGAADMASISHVDWNKGKVIGSVVTDAAAVTEFYRMSVSLISYGNDDFQPLMFGNIPEAEQADAYAAFADDNMTLCIEATSGLRFFIQLYPSYGWMGSGGTMSFYQMNEAMHQWVDRYLG